MKFFAVLLFLKKNTMLAFIFLKETAAALLFPFGSIARLVVGSLLSLALAACGGEGNTKTATSPPTLSLGATVTLADNSQVLVPPGTIVTSPNGPKVEIYGSHTRVHTQVGAIIVAPATTSGAFDNLVSTAQAFSDGTSTSVPTITAIAGSPTSRGIQVNGTGTDAQFWVGEGLAVDAVGNIIISDAGVLRKITPAGVVTTMTEPGNFHSIAVNGSGEIYGCPYEIAAITFTDIVYAMKYPVLTTLGTVQEVQATWLPPSSSSSLPQVNITGGVAFDKSGNFYFADGTGNRILKITPGGNATVFAGSGTAALSDGVGTSAAFHGPTTLATDVAGNLIVNDFMNGAIRRISQDGAVTTIARVIMMGRYLAVDGAGNIFVNSLGSIKRIDLYGNITTFPVAGVTDPISNMVADHSGSLYFYTEGVGAQVWRVSF